MHFTITAPLITFITYITALYYIIIYVYLIKFLAKLKERPTPQKLSLFTSLIAAHWKFVGDQLLKPQYVKIIASRNESPEELCREMLLKWLETDTSASYSKLIDTLNKCDLNDTAGQIKNKVLLK